MNNGCDDPIGFQGIDPNLFVIVGAILGDVMANELPFNVQNAVGNWLQLVGQVILTYNAQQQYFEQGPGRYFNPANFNVDNSNCQANNQSSGQNENSNSANTSSEACKTEDKSMPNDELKSSGETASENTMKSEKPQEDTIRYESVNMQEMQEQMKLLLEKITSLESEVQSLKSNLKPKDLKVD